MFRHLNLRIEEDEPKEEEVENEEELDENAETGEQDGTEEESEGEAKEEGKGDEGKEEGESSDAEESGKDEGEGDKKTEEDSGGEDEGNKDKDGDAEGESGGEGDGESGESDPAEEVEAAESDKAPDQPTSEPQQTAEGQKEPDVKDINAQPQEVAGAEVSASGADVSASSPTVVIAGFPSIGKTTFASQRDDVKDLESSLYSKKPDGSKNPDFPGNYVNMIKWHLVNNNWKYLLVSSHEDVRKALKDDGINFFTLYPEKSRKEEFLKNFKERGNTDEFISLMEENWDTWIDEMAKETKSYALKEGEYLSEELFDNSLKFLKQ